MFVCVCVNIYTHTHTHTNTHTHTHTHTHMYIGATRLRADARLTRDGVDSDVRLRYASMDLSNPFYNSCMREMPAEVFFSR